MPHRQLQNLAAVLRRQGEGKAHAEEHHRGQRPGQELCRPRDGTQQSHPSQQLPGSAQIQEQSQQAHNQEGGLENVHQIFRHLPGGNILPCRGGEDSQHRVGNHGLGQIQNSHAVGLRSPEQGDKQGNAHHPRLLRRKQHGQVMVWIFAPSGAEGPHRANQQNRQNHGHGQQRTAVQLHGQAGIEHHTGQADTDGVLLQAPILGLRQPVPFPGDETQGHRSHDGCHHRQGRHELFQR